MGKRAIIFCLACLLTACGLSPKPLTVDQRYDQAIEDVKQLFAEQPEAPEKIDYYQALMRSMKYNLDYRIKLVNTALQAGQLEIAAFTLFPTVNMSGSLYSRDNDLSSFGITAGNVSTGLSSSTPRTLRSARVGATWNILDFGMGYVRASQQSQRVLVAEEEARRQLQQLSQDVLVAYWSAYSAQELMKETKEFQNLLNRSKTKLERAVRDNTVPKETLLNYQSALLDGSRRMIQLQYKYDKAISDLKHLLFLPLDKKFVLAPPPDLFLRTQDLKDLNMQKMDAITLVNHPELRGQNYQQRIAKFGVETVILQALPGIPLNMGWNYNSNQFLLNNKWMDRELDVAWNLLNLASLPASYRTAKLQVKYEELKAMALTMAALTETRYAYSRYQTLRQEFIIAHKQTENSNALYVLNKNRRMASLASDQQVILAKLRSITSKMDEDLLLSDLSVALGQLYLSVGVDILPQDAISQPLPQAIATLKRSFAINNTINFSHFIDTSYINIFGKQSPYTIQLYASSKIDDVKKYQNQLPIHSNLALGKIKHKEKEFYVLTYGKYLTYNQAKEHSKYLPKPIMPWVRDTKELTWIS